MRVQWHVFDFFRVTQGGGCNGSANIDVQTRPFAVGVCRTEPGQAGVDPAYHLTTRLDTVQRFAGMGRNSCQRAQHGCNNGHIFKIADSHV